MTRGKNEMHGQGDLGLAQILQRAVLPQDGHEASVALDDAEAGGQDGGEAAGEERRLRFSPLRNHFRRMFIARNSVILVGVPVILALVFLAQLPLPLPTFGVAIGLFCLANALTWWRLRSGRHIGELEVMVHLMFDILLLTGVLYTAGGARNPFATLIFLPVTVAAVALPRAHAVGVALFAAACIEFLLFFYSPVDRVPYSAEIAAHLITLSLIAYLGISISAVTRSYDQLLARARERELRSQHMVHLGAIGAGAAHEMSTPLSTMSVLVQELRRPDTPEAERTDALRILADQIESCRKSLSRLTHAAGGMRAEGGGGCEIDSFLAHVVEDYEVAHPGVQVRHQLAGALPAPQIVGDHHLARVILALLDSAAVASAATTPRPVPVDLSAAWDASSLTIRVCDVGPDIASDAGEFLGDPEFPAKAPGRGMGLGLQAAASTARQFGGELTLKRGSRAGACAELRLPLDALVV